MSKLGLELHRNDLVLRKPHVTERSSELSFNEKHPVYTFRVANWAGKAAIATAVKKLYGVKPLRVNLVRVPAKQVVIRGKIGHKAGYKKALVFLKAGDKIEFV